MWADGDAVGPSRPRAALRPHQRAQLLGAQHDAARLCAGRAGHADPCRGLAGTRARDGAASPTPLWPRQLLLSRAFASQAGCYVIAVGGGRLHSDTPERYRELSTIEYSGDSYIIDPRGEIIAGPAQGETILIAEGSQEVVLAAKPLSDIGGHYSRPGSAAADRRPIRRIGSSIAASPGRVAPDMWE